MKRLRDGLFTVSFQIAFTTLDMVLLVYIIGYFAGVPLDLTRIVLWLVILFGFSLWIMERKGILRRGEREGYQYCPNCGYVLDEECSVVDIIGAMHRCSSNSTSSRSHSCYPSKSMFDKLQKSNLQAIARRKAEAKITRPGLEPIENKDYSFRSDLYHDYSSDDVVKEIERCPYCHQLFNSNLPDKDDKRPVCRECGQVYVTE